jgi:hypothetical protein
MEQWVWLSSQGDSSTNPSLAISHPCDRENHFTFMVLTFLIHEMGTILSDFHSSFNRDFQMIKMALPS